MTTKVDPRAIRVNINNNLTFLVMWCEGGKKWSDHRSQVPSEKETWRNAVSMLANIYVYCNSVGPELAHRCSFNSHGPSMLDTLILCGLMLGQCRRRWPNINPYNTELFLFNSYSAGIDFSRQNLTSVDVRFCRLSLSGEYFAWKLLISDFLLQSLTDITTLSLKYNYFAKKFQIWFIIGLNCRALTKIFPAISAL